MKKPHIHLKAKKSGLPPWRDLTPDEMESLKTALAELDVRRQERKMHEKRQRMEMPRRCPCEIFYKGAA